MLCGETMSTNDQSAQVTISSIAKKSVSDREWTYLFRARFSFSIIIQEKISGISNVFTLPIFSMTSALVQKLAR
jgi:hypothetical protein